MSSLADVFELKYFRRVRVCKGKEGGGWGGGGEGGFYLCYNVAINLQQLHRAHALVMKPRGSHIPVTSWQG